MFRVVSQFPQISPWMVRLSRIPRWGWIAIGVGIILPIVILLASVALVAIISGAIVLAVVVLMMALRRLWLRLTGKFRDDGRRNVKVIVRHRLNEGFYP